MKMLIMSSYALLALIC